ncbi:hypothetical protein DEAC_c17200 [Desulfosporosinus acididurans]|uniref:Uncharacterized protein n=1 Tax=Desulfosporosinus acididurans TaxID=476652 RepID=A0A0J1INS2_9FIRM|nr:hypothetical protein [Desulfosporosinus acididurans]KLU66321.1 hypothetical protein DEAC_c17200 [Desulfosporosinus acididurans]
MHFEVTGDGAKIVSDVCTELQKTMTKWPLFNSRHEGYGVILEELDELWDEVKKRNPDVKNMRSEAVQVAAMAMKFIMSMENEWELKVQEIDPTLMVCENCNNRPLGNDIPEICERCEDNEWGRPSNFVRRRKS